MKSVVFICLLSLSLSLSQPTTQATPEHPENSPAKSPVQPAVDVKNPKSESVTEQVKTITASVNAVENNEKSPSQPQNITDPKQGDAKKEDNTAEGAAKVTPKPEGNSDATKQAEPPKKESDEKKTETNEKPEANANNAETNEKNAETKGTTEKNEKNEKNAKEGEAEKKPANGTQTDAKKTETTTDKTQTAPSASPKDVQPVQARAFDGPSFFGGIILTLGLLAIGFMGYKYYKNQHGDNYHTL